MRVLVTRPEPGAAATASRLRKLGHVPIVAPLLVTRALDWAMPAGEFDAVAFTSAAAPTLGGGGLAGINHLPAYAVGEATAHAARALGFGLVKAARGDASAVFVLATAEGVKRLLHLAGRDRSESKVPPGLQVTVVEVYVANVVDTLPGFDADVALFYSMRTAAVFAKLFEGDRAILAVAALSPGIAATLGSGWANIAVASEPTEDALFAAAGLTCK